MNKKRYKRASELYESGELDKALKECEIGISENLKEASLLNLKGIILYQRGNLSEARMTWNINKDFNDDELAKVYINDSKKDKDNIMNYEIGDKALNELRIDDAIVSFEKCKKTSFNGLRLNTALATCYFKKGMIDQSKYYALKALKIDKNYYNAKSIIKEIEALNKNSKKLFFNIILIMSLIIISFTGVFIFYHSYKGSNEQFENLDGSNKVDKENELSENEQNIEGDTLDISLIKYTIGEKNVDKLYDLLKDVDKLKVKNDDLFIIENGFELLKTYGVEKFYSDGREAIKNKDFEESNNQLKKAYEYGKEHYLYPHIVYLRGNALEELMKKDEAIIYYEEYINSFKTGDYREEALYKLSLIYNIIDKEMSRKYAKELKNNYPNSIYNNNNIKEILES